LIYKFTFNPLNGKVLKSRLEVNKAYIAVGETLVLMANSSSIENVRPEYIDLEYEWICPDTLVTLCE